MQHCFSVSHQALPTKVDRYDFIDHLQCKHLIVDVFDGDSLIFLGSVNVPLKVYVPLCGSLLQNVNLKQFKSISYI